MRIYVFIHKDNEKNLKFSNISLKANIHDKKIKSMEGHYILFVTTLESILILFYHLEVPGRT